MGAASETAPSIGILLNALRLASVAVSYEAAAGRAANEGWTFEYYLSYLLELEVE